jgi:uncharacterized damage-inducible protein DinB
MSNAETATAHPIVAPQIDALAMSRGLLHKLVDDLSDEQMLHRTCPNGNHPLWCVGHIAATEQYLLTTLADSNRFLPAQWDALFQFASRPQDDAQAYPGKAQLLEQADAMRDRVVAWLASLDEKTLATPIDDGLGPFAKSFAQVGASFVLHETFHLGQISAARRAMGLPPLF